MAFPYALLTKTINRVLQLDPEACKELSTFESKTIALFVEKPTLTFFCTFENTAVKITGAQPANETPDVSINGRALDLLELVISDKPAMLSSLNSSLRIEGDVLLAQAFQQFVDRLDLDWDELLSKYTGDVVAHQLTRFAKHARRWLKTTKDEWQLDVKEYLQDEKRLLVARKELEEFFTQVTGLRYDVERLSLRVNRLKDAS